jgi:Phosphotransferase enzyme family
MWTLIVALTDLANEGSKDLAPQKSVLEKSEIKSNTVLLGGQQTDLSLVVKLMTETRGMQCKLSRRPVFGDHDWIIFVQYADNIEWIARVPLRPHKERPQLDFGSPLFKARYECMMHTIEYVAANTTLPVPRVHKYDLTSNNILLRPYILMDCLPGKPLSSVMDTLTEEQVTNIVNQWAQYNIELSNHAFPQIGTLGKEDDRYVVGPLLPEGQDDNLESRGPFRSVADYILGMSNMKKRTIAVAKADPHTYGKFLRSSLIESLIPFFVLPEFLSGPFVLSHPGLDLDSILVDTSGRLTGILSWHKAAVLPLQSHIRVPETLNLEFMPPSERAERPATARFSTKFRPHYERAMVEAAAGTPWNVDELIDRSLMYGLFERAILRSEDERYLPALWEHVFGTTFGAEDFRGAMKGGDWGLAMADRWGIKIQR